MNGFAGKIPVNLFFQGRLVVLRVLKPPAENGTGGEARYLAGTARKSMEASYHQSFEIFVIRMTYASFGGSRSQVMKLCVRHLTTHLLSNAHRQAVIGIRILMGTGVHRHNRCNQRRQ